MVKCPCCSDTLLRHIRSGQTYLLCRSCRLEILDTHHRKLVGANTIPEKSIEKATSSRPNREELAPYLLP